MAMKKAEPPGKQDPNLTSKLRLSWLSILVLISLVILLPGFADDEEDYGDDFFALPSPNEILAESEELEMDIRISRKNARVLGTNFEELAKKDDIMTVYKMGRVFCISGFHFKNLDNSLILKLAGRIYKGTSTIDLPETISNEINEQYSKMLRNPKWNREELMISFTAARSSLMYLLIDKKKVKAKDRPRLETLAVCLELGIWYQSIYLATEHLKIEKLNDFYEIYMDEDVFAYFKRVLANSRKTYPTNTFIKDLEAVNDLCIKIIEDEKISEKELKLLKPLLDKVID